MYILAFPLNENRFQECYFYRMKNGKPQVFTFENDEEINTCMQMFQQWAIPKYIHQNRDPFSAMEIMNFVSSWHPIEKPKGLTCDLIAFKDILAEKGI
jgi:hypothetical protein